MPTITYTSTLVQETVSFMRASTEYEVLEAIESPAVASSGNITNTLTNYGNVYDTGSFNFLIPPVSPPRQIEAPSSLFSPSKAIFDDGVYKLSMSATYNVDLEEDEYTYETTSFCLVTQNIDELYDIWFANYNPNNATDVANLLYLDTKFAQIETLSSNLVTNKNAINALINNIRNYFAQISISPILTSIDADTLLVTFRVLVQLTYSAQELTLTKTLGAATYSLGSFPLDYLDLTKTINSGDAFTIPIYTDGVYYLSGTIEFNGNEFNINNSYLVLTTTIDSLYQSFLLNYNPENSFQSYYAELLVNYFAQIQTLSSNIGTNQAAINELIVLINSILTAVVQDVYLILTAPNELTINFTFNGLPSGTYTNQLLTINQLGTDNEYEILGFPEDDEDFDKIVTSTEFNGGGQYPDGVYLLSGSFKVNDSLYTVTEYALVLTEIDCSMAKLGAKLACACSEKLVAKGCTFLTYYDSIKATFEAGEYNSTITLIKKLQNLLNKNGCGCGC